MIQRREDKFKFKRVKHRHWKSVKKKIGYLLLTYVGSIKIWLKALRKVRVALKILSHFHCSFLTGRCNSVERDLGMFEDDPLPPFFSSSRSESVWTAVVYDRGIVSSESDGCTIDCSEPRIFKQYGWTPLIVAYLCGISLSWYGRELLNKFSSMRFKVSDSGRKNSNYSVPPPPQTDWRGVPLNSIAFIRTIEVSRKRFGFQFGLSNFSKDRINENLLLNAK